MVRSVLILFYAWRLIPTEIDIPPQSWAAFCYHPSVWSVYITCIYHPNRSVSFPTSHPSTSPALNLQFPRRELHKALFRTLSTRIFDTTPRFSSLSKDAKHAELSKNSLLTLRYRHPPSAFLCDKVSVVLMYSVPRPDFPNSFTGSPTHLRPRSSFHNLISICFSRGTRSAGSSCPCRNLCG